MYICTLFMAYLLHIDTSTDIGSVAVSHNGKLIHSISGVAARNHAGTVNSMISDCLATADITLNDIAAVVVCAGPGSYTGLRIAMATAKGICYALDKPLILNNKLTLLALNQCNKENDDISDFVAAILVAREKEYYMSIYTTNKICIQEPIHTTENDAQDLLKKCQKLHIISDLPEEEFHKMNVVPNVFSADITIDYIFWAAYAYEQFTCQEFVNIAAAAPFYLKQVYTHN